MDSERSMWKTPVEKLGLRERVQDFVNYVCEREGWEAPRVEILSWEAWLAIAIQHTDGHVLSEKLFGWPDRSTRRIYINPRHVNRITVLHELYHYNTIEKSLENFKEEIGRMKEEPKLFSGVLAALELQAEANAKRLRRKYTDEWKKRVDAKRES